MSRYLREGYLYFPPVLVGGPTGNYVTMPPISNCEEAEYEIVSVATTDTGTPMILVTGSQVGDGQPKQLAYDGTVSLGKVSGTDNGSQAYPGIAIAWGGASIPAPPVGEFFPIVDSEKRVFTRIDCAGGKSVYVTLRYRCRPVRSVVANVETHETAGSYNAASAEKAAERLRAHTIAGRGEAVNI